MYQAIVFLPLLGAILVKFGKTGAGYGYSYDYHYSYSYGGQDTQTAALTKQASSS